MKTSFTAEQLRDPRNQESKQIIETCVHYGFCTNTCPTYVLTRDENESPRGRIDMIRAMLEKGGAPDPQTVKHLDSCLSCLSCMTTCAVKVDYVHLIDHARAYIENNYRRSLPDRVTRAALSYIIPRPRVFGMAMALGKGMRPLRRVMPTKLRPLIDIIPEGTRSEILAPTTFPAEGHRRKRVALLAGCAQQVLNADINSATIRLLQRHGCEVVVTSGAGCCGSLPLHMGKDTSAKAMARRNIDAWAAEREARGLDAIVVNASGCGTTVKDYGHLFGDEPQTKSAARTVAGLARDVTEVLADLGLNAKAEVPGYRVAYHDPCSMQHGQKVTRQPRALLRAAGFTVLDVPEKHFCCGSAGTYNLLQPDNAAILGQRKAEHVASTDPDIVATGNIGCTTQIQAYSAFPVLHTVELLDWATGGPIPPRLAGVKLRIPVAPDPEPASALPVASVGAADPDDGGFW